MRTAQRVAWLGGLLLLIVHCRIERVEPPKGPPEAAGESPRAVAPTSGVLVGAGVDEHELQTAARAVCQALARRSSPLAALEDALGRLECGRRARGSAFTQALLLDAARWGAASGVPETYLASEAAGRALAAHAGLVYSVPPLLPLAHCELLEAQERLEVEEEVEAEAEVEPEPDADAGAEALPDLAPPSLRSAPVAQAGAPDERIVLLLRGPHARFHAAFLSTAPAPDLAPPGVLLLPGQLLYAGADRVVYAEPLGPRDFLRDPAPAARLYAARGDERDERTLVLDDREPAPSGGRHVQTLGPEACAQLLEARR